MTDYFINLIASKVDTSFKTEKKNVLDNFFPIQSIRFYQVFCFDYNKASTKSKKSFRVHRTDKILQWIYAKKKI